MPLDRTTNDACIVDDEGGERKNKSRRERDEIRQASDALSVLSFLSAARRRRAAQLAVNAAGGGSFFFNLDEDEGTRRSFLRWQEASKPV